MPQKTTMSRLKTEFLNDMGSNALGEGQKIRQIENYILEYYKDSFTIGRDKTKPRLQLYRKAKNNESHFREWKQISNFENFDGDLWELFNNLTFLEAKELED
jgi:hypothetical protein